MYYQRQYCVIINSIVENSFKAYLFNFMWPSELADGCLAFHIDKYIHKCLEGCNVSFNKIHTLRSHLEKSHKIIPDEENLKFPSRDEFSSWILNLNKDCVQYVCAATKKPSNGFKATYYYCNRSAGKKYSPAVLPENRKRKLKAQGTCKLKFSCTSVITSWEDLKQNTISVIYYKTHYGHEKDIQHIRMMKSNQPLIISPLRSDASISFKMEQDTDNFNQPFSKRQHLMREDLHDIITPLQVESKSINYLTMTDSSTAAIKKQMLVVVKNNNAPLIFVPLKSSERQDRVKIDGLATDIKQLLFKLAEVDFNAKDKDILLYAKNNLRDVYNLCINNANDAHESNSEEADQAMSFQHFGDCHDLFISCHHSNDHNYVNKSNN